MFMTVSSRLGSGLGAALRRERSAVEFLCINPLSSSCLRFGIVSRNWAFDIG